MRFDEGMQVNVIYHPVYYILNPQSSGGELMMILFLSLPCCRAELGGGDRPTVPVSLDCEPTNTLCIDVYREWRGLFTSIGDSVSGVIERPLFRSLRVQEEEAPPIRKATRGGNAHQ